MSDTTKKLEEMHVPVGGWTQTEGGAHPTPSVLAQQRALLGSLRDLIKMQIGTDKAKSAELQETLSRLKHGGGR